MRQHGRATRRMRGWSTTAIFILIVSLMAHSAAVASSMRIMTPPAFSAVDADHLSVVGTSTCTSVTLIQPGRPPQDASVIDGWFHLRAELNYGFNELYIASAQGDSVWLAAIRLPFMANLRRTKVHYPNFIFHGNEIGSDCADCHALAPFTQSDGALPDTTCQSCHQPNLEWIQPHKPAAESECRICHGSGDLPIPFPVDNRSLCQGCHKGKIEQFDKEFVHGPVGAGSCLACHDPHGSAVSFALRKPVQLLCLGCHETTDANADGKLLHAPFGDGACTACHDPHATNYAWGMSRRSNSICLPCHPMDEDNNWHSHPTTGRPHSGRKEIAVNDQGELECTSCHDPHYSDAPHLLRTTEDHTCRGCHEDK